jgi:phytoene desaturase
LARRAPHVVVVGAGVGGLAAALRLAHRGCRVTVLERREAVGGRNHRVRVGEADFDAGPTLLLMREPLERLFADLGLRLADHLSLSLCDPGYRAWYGDGESLDATPNLALMVQRISALCGRAEAERYARFIGDAGELYRCAVPQFVRRDYGSVFDLARPSDLYLVARHRLLANYWQRLGRYVTDERLKMLLSFQTMYLGLSPRRAPWVYSVLAYMELGEGVWYPHGGVAAVTEALLRLAQGAGVEVRTACAVRSVRSGKVELADGETVQADAVLCNADLPQAEQHLLGRKRVPRRYSCSALVAQYDYDGPLDGLLHHNVFFGGDFHGHLAALEGSVPIPEEPAFYACVSSKTEPGRARPGGANLMVLVPVPDARIPLTDDGRGRILAAVARRLSSAAGFEPDRVRAARVVGPDEWQGDYSLDVGAAFGLSHDFWQSVVFRPSNQDPVDSQLYYVGASTRPGNGLPMVLISAELAVGRMVTDGVVP